MCMRSFWGAPSRAFQPSATKSVIGVEFAMKKGRHAKHSGPLCW
jgi:hypothetical protein